MTTQLPPDYETRHTLVAALCEHLGTLPGARHTMTTDPDPIRLMCGCTINPNTGKRTLCPTDQARHEAQTADALDALARAANLPPLTPTQREQLRDQDT